MSDACAACGMPVKASAYHPFAACQLFKQTRSSVTVEANIRAVVEYGFLAALAGRSVDHVMKDIRWNPRASTTKAKTRP